MDTKLIELPVTRACIEKWIAGRADKGPEFVGDPLEELFGELVDAINYADQAEIEGFNVGEIRASLWNLANDVQLLASHRTTANELFSGAHVSPFPAHISMSSNGEIYASRANDE